MATTRVTVRYVDQATIDRVRNHVREHGLYLGAVVNVALQNYMDAIDGDSRVGRPLNCHGYR